jgi:hypothetical protein
MTAFPPVDNRLPQISLPFIKAGPFALVLQGRSSDAEHRPGFYQELKIGDRDGGWGLGLLLVS